MYPAWANNSTGVVLTIISVLASGRPCISSSSAVKPYFRDKNGKQYPYGDDLNIATDLQFVVVMAFKSFKEEGKMVVLMSETTI